MKRSRKILIVVATLGLIVSIAMWLGVKIGRPIYYSDGNVESIQLRDLDAWGVRALESAGRDSVYALYDGNVGNGIAIINSDGEMETFTDAGGSMWTDMIAF